MAVLQEFKCPCCDGAIEFDSSSQPMPMISTIQGVRQSFCNLG